MPVDREALLKDLREQVRLLEEDLRIELDQNPEKLAGFRSEWEDARKAERLEGSDESWLNWREGQITQTAVAWVLGTVFVRFSEDNGLLEEPWLSGRGERLHIAEDREHAYFMQDERHQQLTPRDWMKAAFDHMAASNRVTAGLFNRYNPLYRMNPSAEAARSLLSFWRMPGEERDSVRHDFTDPDLETRFLGDLYQDLSDHAKKTFALLQTPDFVEEFILDRTMTPALEEYGVAPAYPFPELREHQREIPDVLRVIDPTCGSGHFLLGAFNRLLEAWLNDERSNRMTGHEIIRRVLTGIHGVDKNPFAVEIARFRLLIAATKADRVQPLKDMPNWEINVAVGDSLIHGRDVIAGFETLRNKKSLFDDEVEEEQAETHTFSYEDVPDFIDTVDLLGAGSYHVVVGNPPYITVKDKAESNLYKERYKSCYRQYSLSVPFAERFFKLAIRNQMGLRPSGHVGQITANSFMKREFGKKLIENFFWVPDAKRASAAVHLTEVIDTSGAYIPGHGTPTVILVGRNAFPQISRPIRAVLGIRGEPGVPENPADGLVWSAIVDQIDRPGSESEYVSVTDLDRVSLSEHPWSLSGGGAADLRLSLEASGVDKLKNRAVSIGFQAVTREDDVYAMSAEAARRIGFNQYNIRPLAEGECIRDWRFLNEISILFPYDNEGLHEVLSERDQEHYWKYRMHLSVRKALGGTQNERGLPWYEYSDFHPSRWSSTLKLSFAFVATHNHFWLNRGGVVFTRSAPLVSLKDWALEGDHLTLLGVLNSSTACFWLKQVSHDKGSQSGTGGFMHDEWERFYEFTGTKLQEFPLPSALPLELGRRIDELAQQLSETEPSATCASSAPSAQRLEKAHEDNDSLRRRMIALQEELDWQVYGSYGLLDKAEASVLTAKDFDQVPEVKLGQRAFEIVMARQIEAGTLDTVWFSRHRSVENMTTDIPSDWPEWYQALVQRRIDKLTSDRNIGLIERPEHKRRWAHEPWDKREKEALRNYLLDACEDRSLWYETGPGGVETPVMRTVYALADLLQQNNPAAVEAARLYAETDTVDLSRVLTEILETEHVPYLAALRYKEPGLRKRAEWEKTWKAQREEDETGVPNPDIAVPPKYSSADFLKTSYWRHRGKLDVPKERFISYPDASLDPSLLLGWAGWNHRDQAGALWSLYYERKTQSSWELDRLTPIMAGLLELMQWLHQWYDEPDPAFRGQSPATILGGMFEEEKTTLGISDEDLRAWRPAKRRRRGGKAGGQ